MRTKKESPEIELTALDTYLFREDAYPIHKALLAKLSITFIKSKESIYANLIKPKTSTRKRRTKPCPKTA